jgi:hypothetical protein
MSEIDIIAWVITIPIMLIIIVICNEGNPTNTITNNNTNTVEFSSLSKNEISNLSNQFKQKLHTQIIASDLTIENVSEQIYIYWEEILYKFNYNITSPDYLIILLDGGVYEIMDKEENEYEKVITINKNIQTKTQNGISTRIETQTHTLNKNKISSNHKNDDFVMNIINDIINNIINTEDVLTDETIAISTQKNSKTSIIEKDAFYSFSDLTNIPIRYYELSKIDEMINDLDKAFSNWDNTKKESI